MLLHGIEDPYVPLGQYLQYYRALKDKGKVVQLLMFPREGHGLEWNKDESIFLLMTDPISQEMKNSSITSPENTPKSLISDSRKTNFFESREILGLAMALHDGS